MACESARAYDLNAAASLLNLYSAVSRYMCHVVFARSEDDDDDDDDDDERT